MGQRLLIRVHPCLSVVEFLGLQLAALGSLPRQGLWQGNQTDRVLGPHFLAKHFPAIRRDTACSFDDFSTNGGICTGHGGTFFYHTKPL